MKKYKHALALNPYFGDSTATMGIFPPTGLEYIVASMKDLVDKVTLLDLRYHKAFQDPRALGDFIRSEIDLLCISVRWETRFEQICDFISQLPDEVTTVEVDFAPTASGTQVTVTHHGFAALPADHPVRHGADVPTFVRRMGMWWGDLASSLRLHVARTRDTLAP